MLSFITGHIGRLGEYAEEATAAGCIGLITVGKGAGPMVPYGGSQGTFSTNPIAIGVPIGDAASFIVDYATSVIRCEPSPTSRPCALHR